MTTYYCFFPHCDDEVTISEHIRAWVKNNDKVLCFFFAEDLKIANEREQESKRYLNQLGIRNDSIIFLYKDVRCKDGTAVDSLSSLAEFFENKFKSPGHIISPAWEGGHQDHDAIFILAKKLSLNMNCPMSVYYTYSARWTKNKLFYFNRAITEQVVSKKAIKLSRLRALFHCVSIFKNFPSQWRTWIALSPIYFLKLLINPEQALYAVRSDVGSHRPHEGKLLYEAFQRMSWDEFHEKLLKQGFNLN